MDYGTLISDFNSLRMAWSNLEVISAISGISKSSVKSVRQYDNIN